MNTNEIKASPPLIPLLMRIAAAALLLSAAAYSIDKNWGVIPDSIKQLCGILLLIGSFLGLLLAQRRQMPWTSELLGIAVCACWAGNIALQGYLFNSQNPSIEGLVLILLGILPLPFILPLRGVMIFVVALSLGSCFESVSSAGYISPLAVADFVLLSPIDPEFCHLLAPSLLGMLWAIILQQLSRKAIYQGYALLVPLAWVVSGMLCLGSCFELDGHEATPAMGIWLVWLGVAAIIGAAGYASLRQRDGIALSLPRLLIVIAPTLLLLLTRYQVCLLPCLGALIFSYSVAVCLYAWQIRQWVWLIGGVCFLSMCPSWFNSHADIPQWQEAAIVAALGLFSLAMSYLYLKPQKESKSL